MTGSETGSEMGRDKFMLGFRVPTTCGKKTSITTYSDEVSPPPATEPPPNVRQGARQGVRQEARQGARQGTGQGARHGVRQGAR